MPVCFSSLGCESIMVSTHSLQCILPRHRQAHRTLCVASERCCTMDNIHTCTDEGIDWSLTPAVLRAENWALIRVLQSTVGSSGFDIVSEPTISSSHCQRSSCYDVQAITTGNAHLHSPSTRRVTATSTVQSSGRSAVSGMCSL